MRSLESASLYSQHSAQLEDYIQSQTTNILERVYVENVRIKDFYENPDGNDTLVVILSSTLRDYVIEDKTRKVIEGDPQKDLFTVYQMNFIRKHGSQTENNVQDEAVSDHCPNCGAPLKISAIANVNTAELISHVVQTNGYSIPMMLWMKTNYIIRRKLWDLFVWAKEQIKGVVDVAKSAGINSLNDSKFKEAVVLPEHVSSEALAVKGILLTKDPDGVSRQGNQHTGLLTDGSVVIVPQGYVAILVNNGTFLGDVLEAGSHEWRSGDNAWLLEKGGIRGTWENFKHRFSFAGQVVTQQEIILSVSNRLRVINLVPKTL